MSLIDGMLHVLRSVVGRKRADDETREELAYHLHRQTQKHVAAGLEPAEAARRAAIELGGTERWREETASTRRGSALFDIAGDARLAFRGLLARPGFALSGIATTVIGTGSAIAIFAVGEATVLRPLPFRDPSRLMSVTLRMPRNPTTMVDMVWSYPKFALFRDRQRVFSSVALHSPETMIVASNDGAERLPAEMASAELFALLEVEPMIGRTFTRDEDRVGGPSDVVVLSEGLWRARFDGRRDAIGATLAANGRRRTVIGVMPATFRGLSGDAQFWVPVPGARSATALEMDGAHNMEVIARLANGISPAAARAATRAIGGQIDATFPDDDGHWGADAYQLDALRVSPSIQRSIRLLAIAVLLVLAIVAVNLGTLLLTRTTARRQELAIRSALGAERGRLMRQLVTESGVLVAIGTAIGFSLAWVAVRVLASTLPLSAPTTASGTDLTRLTFRDVGIGPASVVLAVGIGVAMTLGIGLVAAARATDRDVVPALRQSGGSSASSTRGFLRANGLVVVQTALALVFLVGAGLTIQSLRRTLSIPLGYSPEGLLAVRVSLDPSRATSDSNATLWRAMIGELRALPGVTVAGAGSCSPLGMHCDGTTITPVGHAPGHVAYMTASPDYFDALKTPVLRGRVFTDEEIGGRRRVAVINQAAAKALWGSDDPLTTPIRQDTTMIEVIGIVGDARYGDVERPAEPAVFFPHRDARGVIFVRTTTDAAAIGGSVRVAIRRAGNGHAIADVRTMGSRLRDATARNRLSLQVFTTFAISALLLAGIGVYGTLALRVAQRARELAIRRALGASTASLAASVSRQAAAITFAGGCVGLISGAVVARAMSSLLYDVSALDPAVYVSAAALLAVAVALASALPTARTVRTDPRDAMRAD